MQLSFEEKASIMLKFKACKIIIHIKDQCQVFLQKKLSLQDSTGSWIFNIDFLIALLFKGNYFLKTIQQMCVC